MTDAASKKVNKSGMVQGQGQMRTTHPSYTEYSWNNLVPRPAAQPKPNLTRASTSRPQAQRTAVGYAPARTGNPIKNINTGTKSAPISAQRPVKPNAPGSRTNPGISADIRRQSVAGRDSVAKSNPAAKSAAAEQQTAAVKIRKKSITTLHTIVTEKRYSFPLSTILIAFTITVLILAIITTSVRINEITTANSTLQRTYNSLISDENQLRLMLETRDDLRHVESTAKNELGMVKKDQVKKYYLTVHKEDRIELVEEVIVDKRNIFDELLSFGGSIVERIRAFFGL